MSDKIIYNFTNGIEWQWIKCYNLHKRNNGAGNRMDKKKAYTALRILIKTSSIAVSAIPGGSIVAASASAVAELMGLTIPKNNVKKTLQKQLESVLNSAAKDTWSHPNITPLLLKYNFSELEQTLGTQITQNQIAEWDADPLSGAFLTHIDSDISADELQSVLKIFKTNYLIYAAKCPELCNYIQIKDLEDIKRSLQLIHEKLKESEKTEPSANKILTPDAVIWETQEFMGREKEQSYLSEKIESGSIHIQLTGMGGIGKTELLRWLYRNYTECAAVDHVAYFNYKGSADSMLMSELKFPGEGIQEAWHYLKNLCEHKKLLILIDEDPEANLTKKQNLERERELAKLHSLRASVVLASRLECPAFEPYFIGYLPERERIELFQKHYKAKLNESDQALLLELFASRAGNNTKIIPRLGSMARTNLWNVRELGENLAEKGFKIEYGMDDKTLQQEIDKLYPLERMTVEELSVLEAFSIFPSIPLEADICAEWLHEDAGLEKHACRRMLGRLSDLTWLEKGTNAQTNTAAFQMHAVVRNAVKAQSGISFDAHKNLAGRCADAMIIGEKELFTKARPYEPFALAVAKRFEKEGSAEIGLLFHQLGYFYSENADYTKALTWYEKALVICEKVLGKEHPYTATSYGGIAGVYDSMGDYPKALEGYEKALAIREKVLGKEHPDTAMSYNNIAFVYDSMGDYPKALEG
ncbi:MAG TPA: hypothetical protein DEQ02_01470, partial [Ruminococcaceae bacterium]|nr:hypothetical protein [Oscillospiraceae bacterium]